MDHVAAFAVISPSASGVPPLRGRALRFVLVDELMRRPEMTVAEMVTVLEVDHGFDLCGRASKVISDALRWETRRGRVARVARGRYRFVRAARSTARRIGILAARCRAWVVAIMRRGTVVPVPSAGPFSAPAGAVAVPKPPWADLRWLRNK